MKYLKYIILSGLVGIAFWACKDDELRPIINYNAIPAITAPATGTVIELKEVNADSVLPAFTWTAADFGFAAGASYELAVDIAGNNFADPTTIGAVSALGLTIKQGDLNTLLLAKGLEGENPTACELRVTATVNSDAEGLVSEVVPVTITPYSATIVLPQLQVPGSYQGWDPANNNTIIYSQKADGKYEGYMYIGEDNAKFKYTVGPSWTTNYGDTGDDGTLDQGGDDISSGGPAGVYKLFVNYSLLTHTRQRTDWGLIGSATADGWNSDQNMTYDAATGKISITTDLVPGEIKFRANDAWDLNYGDDGNNKTLEANGSNIAIATAGNYTIDLLLIKATKFKYAIKKN